MIRIAVANDAQQIAEIHVQSWKETYTGIIKPEVLNNLSVPKRLTLWQQIIPDPDHQLFVYEKNGRILGFLDGYLNPNSNIAEIRAFYLLKNIQGEGVGRAMFETFHQLVHPKQHSILRLEVINKNPSRYFYEKMGGKAVGEDDASDLGEGITEVFYQWDIFESL
ncbi:GNAT family N-acetyltransferase [Acinetobacter piscicola]|uniref:GNAT family N-acetyltransferase n=1 Tax=Acinetobacter piscicola TaxID=2006115 RepID=UPI000B7FE7E3|nr:GNAT family N-acetyltransferase [Acinetobacter piscicola]